MYSQVEVRKFILNEQLKNCNIPVNSLAKKYKVQRKTVNRIIKSWGEGRGLERKLKNRERGPSSLKLDQKLIRRIDANPAYSVRDIGKNTGVPKSTIQEVKKRYGYKTIRKQKIPWKIPTTIQRSPKTRSKTATRKASRKLKILIIMDDETYCKLDCLTYPGQQLYTSPKGTKPDVLLKAIKTERFGKKESL